jgi:Zn-dependent protease
VKILGFPVRIRPGFAVFMLLIVILNGVRLGVWLAASVAVFTLAHELGHAVAARRTGARASISLDFLAGYASFTPTRALTRFERATIALAGPITQIALGVLVLLALGVNPLDHHEFAAEAHSLAIWWAGPIIGLFNLFPVMPLDGGNIAAEVVDTFVPGRGRRLMIKASAPITAAAFVVILAFEDLRPIASFAAILLVIQLQMRSLPVASREASIAETLAATAEAETTAWEIGRPGLMPPDRQPSPWWFAASALRAGERDRAIRYVLDDLRDDSGKPRNWWPPHSATPDQLEAVVDVLPRPLPEPEAAWPEQSLATLVWALRHTGRYHEAAHYGAACYRLHPTTRLAIHVAASLAAEGHHDVASQWLTVAGRSIDADAASEALLLHSLVNDRDLAPLRGRTDVQNLVKSLTARDRA